MLVPLFLTLVPLSALALPTLDLSPPTKLEPRGIPIADGTYMQTGFINPSFGWQSSGQLQLGCSKAALITKCYKMHLSAKGNWQSTPPPASLLLAPSAPTPTAGIDRLGSLAQPESFYSYSSGPVALELLADLDEFSPIQGLRKRQVPCNPPSTTTTRTTTTSPGIPVPTVERQRIEFLSWPAAPAGETWRYKWRTFLNPGVSTSTKFFHLFQIFRRDGCAGAPVVTLDIANGVVGIAHTNVCKFCTSIPLSEFTGRTIAHRIVVRYGISGSFEYTATDVSTSKIILSYSFVGDTGADASLKFGMYRVAVDGMSAATSYVGDYSAKKL